MKHYKKFLKLKKIGFSTNKISKIMGIPQSVLYFWSKSSLPLRYSRKYRDSSLKKIRKYNKINRKLREEKYNNLRLTITPEFAFILGSVLGDGCVTIRKRDNRTMGQIELVTKDKDYAINFKNSLEKWSNTKCKLIFYRNVWHVWSYLLSIARCLRDFDLSNLFGLDDNIKSSFLRGIFDAEGSVDVQSKKIVFANKSVKIIKMVSNILESFKIEPKVYIRNSKIRFIDNRKLLPSSYFVIQISSKENLKLFYESIGFSIKRKQERLENLINSYKPL
jgi:intein-encoded DNA endonuclease-like protein